MTYMTGKATINVATAAVPANQLKLDVDPRIKHHEWAMDVGAVLFAVQGRGGLKKKSTKSVKFIQWEKEAFDRWCYLSAILTSGNVSMSVDDGAGGDGFAHLKEGDVCMLMTADMATRELILITATPVSGTVAISRSFGTSATLEWPDNTPIQRLYNCGTEKSTTPDIKSVVPNEVPNYCGEIRTPMGGSRRALKSEYYTGKKLSELRLEAWIEHLKDLSSMILWGELKAETTYGRTQPQGLWDAIVSRNGYTKNVNGNLTLPIVQEIVRNVFRKGSTRKIALCPPLVIDAFGYFKKDPLIMKPNEEWFNMKVGTFETGQGQLTLIRARQLEGHPGAVDGMFGSSMIIFDEEYMTYRYFADDDTHLVTNTQNPNDFGQQDEYLSDAGIQVDVGPAHGAAYNITGYL